MRHYTKIILINNSDVQQEGHKRARLDFNLKN